MQTQGSGGRAAQGTRQTKTTNPEPTQIQIVLTFDETKTDDQGNPVDRKKNSVVYRGESPMGLAIGYYCPNDIVRALGSPAQIIITHAAK